MVSSDTERSFDSEREPVDDVEHVFDGVALNVNVIEPVRVMEGVALEPVQLRACDKDGVSVRDLLRGWDGDGVNDGSDDHEGDPVALRMRETVGRVLDMVGERVWSDREIDLDGDVVPDVEPWIEYDDVADPALLVLVALSSRDAVHDIVAVGV